MRNTTLLCLMCSGMLLCNTSCSKDDEDDYTPRKPVVDETDYSLIDLTKYKFSGAELYTKESFTYGRFEARMKMAYAPGCISSMFLYYNDSYKGGGKVWNEIDIEVIGKDPNSFQSNLITGTKEQQITSEKIQQLGYAADADYHTYVVEWTPTYVSWTVDGVLARKTEALTDSKKQVEALVEAQSLRFNLWSSKSASWVGNLNPNKLPIAQYIDYVKVSDYDTATGTFTERWTDDFDTFNSTRWAKGDWVMEQVTESPNNVTIEAGKLVMRLTKEIK